jgi:TPR repeat protein
MVHEGRRAGKCVSQNNLGVMYAEGQGVPQDYKEAAKWYTKAAEQGNASAQWVLANMYHEGTGVLEDYVEAYKWAILTVNGTDADSQADAGHLRDVLRQQMTPTQIEEAQRRAKDFLNQRERNSTQSIGR